MACETYTAQSITTTEARFQIPDGYVGILRGFRWRFSQLVKLCGTSEIVNITATVIADNVNLAQYTDIKLPMICNDYYPVYGLSNPLNDVGVRISHPGPADTDLLPLTLLCDIELYGNLLLAKGLPLPYEPTNKVR